ncbi:MAG: hypothetical protein GWN29_10760, partial [Gammaproteobacteria bacterium]|nr:hypothetical protein [Gammaproteobacteria bacterium]
MRFRISLALALLVLPAFAHTTEQAWRFRVYLDNKEIGYHEFRVEEQDGLRRLETEASFEYKLLFLTLYEYEHENTEIWQGDCLAEIEARTDANGDPYEIRGAVAEDRFVLESTEGSAELPRCVMSFAYWNPAFLEQDRLLNSQNGEFVDVVVGTPEPVNLEVRGTVLPALRYRIEAEDLGIELYYSESQEWLALE